ncbi:transcription regulatory protein SWI3 [Sodiomyces alkalinus F11]|uniref:Transcription regulatory protein SWI3 n=1 Tax=Sodiomyces alkalinus (strain CBS 110278 / VKM F-3762 / F11) TaxID=1314773 RepID=A0A3N2PYE5_SODAK|nr:transcription regulatory protein SWI3 [Sodiomyces alkalinus F11]ROT39436.1 transcription regulatory protein SWI3 [Sodiomyces alkalinus F11]
MDDSTAYDSPTNALSSERSPNSAQEAAQPVSSMPTESAEVSEDVKMTDTSARDIIPKQDSVTPAPPGTSDNAPNAHHALDTGNNNTSQVETREENTTGNETEGRDENSKDALDTAARDHLISQTHAIILPSYSTWFDMNAIHDIERKAVPEFFNSRNRSKTPSVYKDYRDFMINTYRLNPSEYLTVTACRRNLAGDVCAIMRVHAFLEQWGLINYQVDGEHRPSNVGPPYTGHFKVICDTPRGLQVFQPSPANKTMEGQQNEDTDKKAGKGPNKAHSTVEVRRNIFHGHAKTTAVNTMRDGSNGEVTTVNGVSNSEDVSKSPETKVNCHVCGIDCTRLYYHHNPRDGSKQVRFDVCPSCHIGNHLPSNLEKSDFTRASNPTYTSVLDRDAPWSDAETMRLLEGLERFDDDWGEIADHVGTRTREECVLRFLQLDIEDKYIDSEFSNLDGFGEKQLPFNQADIPVMSVIGFLAGLADPASTAAAAQKSADELKRRLRSQLEGGGKSPGTSIKGKGKDEGGDSDAMEVDPQHDLTTDTRETATAKTVASISLASIGARAAGLATHEEREMTRLVSAAANVTLEKLELKLKYFSEMEIMLHAERQELEKARHQLFLDRLAFKRRVQEVQESFKAAALTGGDQLLRLAEGDGLTHGDRLGLQSDGSASTVLPLTGEEPIRSLEL